MAVMLHMDDREKPPYLRQLVRATLPPELFAVGRMTAGDYVYTRDDGTVLLLVERKTAGNLVSSIVQRRGETTELRDQLSRCLGQGPAILLVEGTIRMVADPAQCAAGGRLRHVPWLLVQSQLARIQGWGILTVHTQTVMETAHMLRWFRTRLEHTADGARYGVFDSLFGRDDNDAK